MLLWEDGVEWASGLLVPNSGNGAFTMVDVILSPLFDASDNGDCCGKNLGEQKIIRIVPRPRH